LKARFGSPVIPL
jgi:hypothetical protein